MPGSPRPLKPQALWVRVDENRTKLAAFVVLFVVGSALLLTLALVAVPGYLLSWGAGAAEYADPQLLYARMPLVIGSAFLLMLLAGALAAAIQLSNSEHWVRSYFKGRDPQPGEAEELLSSLQEIAIAAGLPKAPSLLILPLDSVNAFAIGAGRSTPTIGVTQGLLASLTREEERAVVATLVARIVAGDIMFGTALAALMGPLKAVRSSAKGAASCADACAGGGIGGGFGDGCDPGCARGCGDADGCADSLGDDSGCGGVIAVVLFLALVAALTYAAVVTASWIVTLWGRSLHRTTYEKADAEGMLLVKDATAMLSALEKAITSSNEVADKDPSYDGIFYVATSGNRSLTAAERRRHARLAEIVGVEGAMADAALSARLAGSSDDDATPPA